jgi:hypothetical protein
MKTQVREREQYAPLTSPYNLEIPQQPNRLRVRAQGNGRKQYAHADR